MLYTVNTKTPYHHFSGDKELFYVLSNLYVLIFRNGLTPLSSSFFSGNFN